MWSHLLQTTLLGAVQQTQLLPIADLHPQIVLSRSLAVSHIHRKGREVKLQVNTSHHQLKLEAPTVIDSERHKVLYSCQFSYLYHSHAALTSPVQDIDDKVHFVLLVT